MTSRSKFIAFILILYHIELAINYAFLSKNNFDIIFYFIIFKNKINKFFFLYLYFNFIFANFF